MNPIKKQTILKLKPKSEKTLLNSWKIKSEIEKKKEKCTFCERHDLKSTKNSLKTNILSIDYVTRNTAVWLLGRCYAVIGLRLEGGGT